MVVYLLALAGVLLSGCASGPPGDARRYPLRIDGAQEAIWRGEARPALDFYLAVAKESESRGAHAEAGRALGLATYVSRRTGALQQSLRSGPRALELLARGSPTVDTLRVQMSVYLNLAHTYRLLGQPAEGQRQLQEGLATVRAAGMSGGMWEGTFLLAMATMAVAESQYDEALAKAEEAARLFERQIDAPRRRSSNLTQSARYHLGQTLLLMARVQLSRGDLAGAERAYRRGHAHARAFELADTEAEALGGLGRVALARRDYRTALTHLEEATVRATRLGAVSMLIPLNHRLAGAQAGEGRLDDALIAIRRAITLIEDVRGQLQESESRSGFVEDKQRVYADAVALALRSGRTDEAFAFAESSRARAFLDILGSRTPLSKGKTRALVDLELRLRARMNLARAELEEASGQTERARGQAELDAAEREYRAFLARVRKDSAEQSSLMTVEPVTLAEIQALIPAGVTLLEYMVTEDGLVLWVIDAARASVVHSPVPRATLVREVRALRTAIAERQPLAEVEAQGRLLHDRLLGPARPLIRGERVLIVPHDVLHYVPFAALRSPDARWLIEDYELATLPSASVLKYLSGKGGRASARTLAVGNPAVGPALNLRYAEREARVVGQHRPETTVLVGHEATESRVKALSEGAGLIHFATHGELSDADPLGSALLLVPDGTDDGRLEVRELFGLELGAELVVLSACETGLGKLSRGDELVGLQRAFLYAGAPAVVTTLWKVDDRASFLLMRTFYAELGRRGPAPALRAAQRAATTQFPHPFAWAAFGLTGVPR